MIHQLTTLLQRGIYWLSRQSNTHPLTSPEINRLVGLCEGVLADGELQKSEVEYIRTWLSVKSGVPER